MQVSINYLAVFVAAVANMVIGALWYGPLFGKMWTSMMGFTEEKMKEMKAKGMGKSYVAAFAASLVMAFVLAHFAAIWNAEGVGGAWQLAFWSWLGFIAPVLLGQVLWEWRSTKLYIINVVLYLVALFAMAIVVVMWK